MDLAILTKNMKKIKKQWTYTGLVLIASLLVGGLAGIVSSVITNKSLDTYMEVISDEEIVLSLSQVKPDPIPGTYEEALSAVYDSYESLAYAYIKTDTSIFESEWLYQGDALGVGVVVTSDGWILFEGNVLIGLDVEDISIYINDQWYVPTEIIQDTKSNAVLVRIDSGGFEAVTFGSSKLAKSGEMVFVVKNSSALFVCPLIDTEYYIQKPSSRAESYWGFWKLQDEMDESLPIFDSYGHFIGFTNGDVDALPFYHIESFIDSVLEFGEPRYAAIGAYAINIEGAVSVDVDSLGTNHGFIIVRPDIYSWAIAYNGPAYEAGLQEHDIIVSIDGVDISSDYPLAEVLSRYSVGDEIVVGLIREAEYVEKTITLENYDLVY